MILLILIDGVGIGERGAQNPLDGCGSAYFNAFRDERLAVPFGGFGAVTDACLGVEGLPQSATGQTSIITGVNAAAILGRHLSAFPGGSLRPILRERSLFRRLSDLGLRVAHANVSPSSIARRRVRTVSATAVAAEECGLKPRTLDDVLAGDALHHEFTNDALNAYGYDVPRIDSGQAGRRLARIASGHDFCVFEFFLTDAAGHAQDLKLAREYVSRLSSMLDGVLARVDLTASTVVLTSDHGNLEDLSTGAHTRNPVATLAWGIDAEAIAAATASLTDIAAAIERCLSPVEVPK